MKKIIRYMANDGTIFNDYEACAEYERGTNYKEYNVMITIKAKTGTVIRAHNEKEAITLGKAYSDTVYPEDWDWDDEPIIEVEEVKR